MRVEGLGFRVRVSAHPHTHTHTRPLWPERTPVATTRPGTRRCRHLPAQSRPPQVQRLRGRASGRQWRARLRVTATRLCAMDALDIGTDDVFSCLFRTWSSQCRLVFRNVNRSLRWGEFWIRSDRHCSARHNKLMLKAQMYKAWTPVAQTFIKNPTPQTQVVL